jgi:cell division protein FtsW
MSIKVNHSSDISNDMPRFSDSRIHARPLQSQNNTLGIDSTLLFVSMSIILLGLVMVFSATIGMQGKSLTTNFAHFNKQFIFVSAGVVFAWIASHIPIQFWERYSFNILCLCALIMSVLLVVGQEVNGSARWIRLGPVNIQPAEVVKLMCVAYVASYLARRREVLDEFTKGIVIIGLVVAVLGGLLLMQPDFGSLMVILSTVAVMMFLGGVKLLHMFLCLMGLVVLVPILVVTQPYRMQRVLSFSDPFADSLGSGYQLVHALIAIGRGEFFGVGIGGSVQKLSYLPHAHNDFIFAVIGEELGLVGIVLVISLFAVFLWRAFMIARQAEGAGMFYGARLAQGIGMLIIIQAMVNIGVNLGVFPTKGLNLPFISYGGSSALVNFVALGILFAVDKQSRARDFRPAEIRSSTLDPILNPNDFVNVREKRRVSYGE